VSKETDPRIVALLNKIELLERARTRLSARVFILEDDNKALRAQLKKVLTEIEVK
jgi:hypothetical protein